MPDGNTDDPRVCPVLQAQESRKRSKKSFFNQLHPNFSFPDDTFYLPFALGVAFVLQMGQVNVWSMITVPSWKMGAEKQEKFTLVKRVLGSWKLVNMTPAHIHLCLCRRLHPLKAGQFRWPFQIQPSKQQQSGNTWLGWTCCVIVSDGHLHTQARCQHWVLGLNSHLGFSLLIHCQQHPASDGQMETLEQGKGCTAILQADVEQYPHWELHLLSPQGSHHLAQGTRVNVLCKYLSGLIEPGILLSLTEISNPSS